MDESARDAAIRMVVENLTDYLIEHPENISRTLYPLAVETARQLTDHGLMKWAARTTADAASMVAEMAGLTVRVS